MDFAFWFAPIAAFTVCIARSNLGRAAVARALAAGARCRAAIAVRFARGARPMRLSVRLR
jgi:hypothetical protein